MAPGQNPDSKWIFENCLLPELQAISPANDSGYYTDLKGRVILTDVQPEDVAEIHQWFMQTGILVWVRGLGMSRTVPGGHLGEGGTPQKGRRHRSFVAVFNGGVRETRDVQMKTLALAEDHFRCMDINPARNQPGIAPTPNTWGVNTILEDDYIFHWEMLKQGLGLWSCAWRIDYMTG